MSENAPSDPGQFVGERDRKNIAVKPLFGRLDTRLKSVALPALRLDQYDPRCLHEQDAQVAIAAFGYPAEDRSASGRHLFGYKAQPGGEVATFAERIAGPDRGHHGGGDDRSYAGYAHQPLASGILPRNGCDLVR